MVPAIMKALGLVLFIFPFPLTLAAGLIKPILHPPSLTATSVQPTATPIIIFDSMGEFTTCTSAALSWLADGPNLPINLLITDVGVSQSEPPSSSSTSGNSGSTFFSNFGTALGGLAAPADDGLTIVAVAQSVDPWLDKYSWSTVNVSQGWYHFIAQTDDKIVVGVSADIFVRNGTDTSCLLLAGGSSPSNTQLKPTSTGTSLPPNTNTGFPSPGTIQRKRLNVAAIVGGVVGGVFLMALVALTCVCTRRKSRTSASLAAGNGGHERGASGKGLRLGMLPFGKWDKLGSGAFNDKDRDPTVGYEGKRETVGSAAQSPRKTTIPPSYKKEQDRRGSDTESIHGMMSSSATTSMAGGSAFHGTDDGHLYPRERYAPMTTISARRSSVASSMSDIWSPFSDPSENDSDSIVYGLHGIVPNSDSPSPIPSSYLYEPSTGTVVGHSSDSDPPSRRGSRGYPDRAFPY